MIDSEHSDEQESRANEEGMIVLTFAVGVPCYHEYGKGENEW